MEAQEILKKAMSNRRPISFQYYKIGKMQAEEIGNARIILISTDESGKETVMLDLFRNKVGVQNKFKNLLPIWRYFDMSEMSNIQILNESKVDEV